MRTVAAGILIGSRASNNGLAIHWDQSWPGNQWTPGASWIAHWYWDQYAPDAAVLDINLSSGTSLPVADALAIAGVPFVFATGFGTSQTLPLRFKDVPLITKPYSIASIVHAIDTAIQRLRAAK